jgi:hypothetical protein
LPSVVLKQNQNRCSPGDFDWNVEGSRVITCNKNSMINFDLYNILVGLLGFSWDFYCQLCLFVSVPFYLSVSLSLPSISLSLQNQPNLKSAWPVRPPAHLLSIKILFKLCYCILPFSKSSLSYDFPLYLTEGNCLHEGLRCQLCHIEAFGKDFSPLDFPLHKNACHFIKFRQLLKSF